MLGTTHGKTISENTVIRNNLVDSEISYPGINNKVDHNIVVKDPNRFFRNPLKYDMRHKQGSPAIDAGNFIFAPEVDINGIRRPNGIAVDVGPYEFEDVHVPVDSGPESLTNPL
ncbi:MAG: choice-of-anchor Q domain-containing protein [Planctomycetota bacterium]